MFPFHVLEAVEAATATERKTTVRFLGTTFNVSLAGTQTTAAPDGAVVLGEVHTGQVLRSAAQALEDAFGAGDGKLIFCKELSAGTDTSQAFFFTLTVDIARV